MTLLILINVDMAGCEYTLRLLKSIHQDYSENPEEKIILQDKLSIIQ